MNDNNDPLRILEPGFTDNPTLQSEKLEPCRTVLPNSRAYDRAGTGDHSLFSNKHCCVCGRPCKCRAAWLLLTRAMDGTQGFAITSPEDATEEERDMSMWIAPIGSDCLRKHPELAHAVINFDSRAPVEQERCEHGVLWSMECLSCGPSDFVAATGPSPSVRESSRSSRAGSD